jgi:hypothetical protein
LTEEECRLERTSEWGALYSYLVVFAKHNENDQVKENMICSACSIHLEKTNTYRVLVGELERKRPLGMPRHRSEDNNKMDSMARIDLAQDRDQ